MSVCRWNSRMLPDGLCVLVLALLPFLTGCATATFDSIMLPGKYPNPRPLFASSEEDRGYIDVFDVCVDSNGVHSYWLTLSLEVVSLKTGQRAKLYIGSGTGFGSQYLGGKSIARISCPEGSYAIQTMRSPYSPQTLASALVMEGVAVKKGLVHAICIETFPETATSTSVKAKGAEIAFLPPHTANDPETEAVLMSLLRSSEYQKQNYAIRYLGIMGDTNSIPALEEALQKDGRHKQYIESAIEAIRMRR